jgi:hypothetical protein
MISDEEMFASDETRSVQALAMLTVRALLAAGLSPPFGVDIDDMAVVWGAELATRDARAVAEATREWTRSGGAFPTLADFLATVDAVATPLTRQATATSGRACSFCGGSGWGEAQSDEERNTAAYSTVMPCETCNTKRWEWWQEGHGAPHHDRGSCDHELCSAPAGQKAFRRSRGRSS